MCPVRKYYGAIVKATDNMMPLSRLHRTLCLCHDIAKKTKKSLRSAQGSISSYPLFHPPFGYLQFEKYF